MCHLAKKRRVPRLVPQTTSRLDTWDEPLHCGLHFCIPDVIGHINIRALQDRGPVHLFEKQVHLIERRIQKVSGKNGLELTGPDDQNGALK